MHWWLLITKGRGSVWRLEYGIRDAHQERIEIGGGYQLVHDSRSWTWKYREEHVLGLKESMRRAIVKRRDGDLNKLIADLYRTVGFRLARKQVGQIMGEGRQKWKLHLQPLCLASVVLALTSSKVCAWRVHGKSLALI